MSNSGMGIAEQWGELSHSVLEGQALNHTFASAQLPAHLPGRQQKTAQGLRFLAAHRGNSGEFLTPSPIFGGRYRRMKS